MWKYPTPICWRDGDASGLDAGVRSASLCCGAGALLLPDVSPRRPAAMIRRCAEVRRRPARLLRRCSASRSPTRRESVARPPRRGRAPTDEAVPLTTLGSVSSSGDHLPTLHEMSPACKPAPTCLGTEQGHIVTRYSRRDVTTRGAGRSREAGCSGMAWTEGGTVPGDAPCGCSPHTAALVSAEQAVCAPRRGDRSPRLRDARSAVLDRLHEQVNCCWPHRRRREQFRVPLDCS
jgi:hypothetical protein